MLYLVVLLSVAFFTLLERKILGYIHFRVGPNKVFLIGLLQPILDGVKLFLKEGRIGFNINKLFYFMFPFLSLFIILVIWQSFCFLQLEFLLNRFLFFILFSTLRVYTVIGRGWVSNSKYSLLGCYRRVAQVISYEVGFVFLILLFTFFLGNYSYRFLIQKNGFRHILFFGFIFLFIIWFVVVVAELNRAPFDFAERESELVSGFNVEFGGLKFAFFFLAEYGRIIYMRYLTILIFMGINLLYCVFFIFTMVWIRGVFPRYRYDNLIYLNWKLFLPFILIFLCVIYFFILVTV